MTEHEGQSDLSPGKRAAIRRWQRIEEAARELFAEALAEPGMPYTAGMEKLRALLDRSVWWAEPTRLEER